jgi:uncharacterized protein YkwD
LRSLNVAVAATLCALSTTLIAPGAHASRADVYEDQIVIVTNNQRTAHDLLPLRPDPCLASFAQRQAERMAENKRIFHQDLGSILRRCDLSTVGENVAYGYADGRAVVSDGWMRSAGHRENILNATFRLMSVGAVQRNGRWYTAQVLGAR